ncbi:MAG: hypothetical protein CBC46_02380 [Verrucomicrobiaceae bacterium TMED86]|nr:MAG: hypothetical protein CBC46_02380 [Verrucomicrobiaceae bacterium TMED86]
MRRRETQKSAPVNRRDVLKSAGCFLMLPALESFGQEAGGDDDVKANRLFCMNIGNGMCSDNFPTSTGKAYQSSSTFQPLEKLKDDFTLCTNLRNYGNHESTMYAFAEYSDHTNPQLIQDSVDEIAASHIGNDTRLRNLVVEQRHSYGISWKGGLPVSPITDGQILFETIFGKVDKKKRGELLALKKSMLDATRDEAKSMMRKVSEGDREKLDEYFSSLRESEKSLQRSERWLSEKQIDVPFPENVPFKTDGLTEYLQKILKCSYFNERSTYLDLLFLAFKFDITRVANVYGEWNWLGHHTDSHAVKTEEGFVKNIEADQAYMMQTARFLEKLKSTKAKAGGTLLDQTVCLITSSLSISKEEGPHGMKNNPVIVAGGGFEHGKHLKFNGTDNRNDVYLAALQHLGVETERFGTSSRSAKL